MDNKEREQDEYDLINSIAIGDYCREIKHKFNTEELAVLIYRNKRMSIDEKVVKYKDLIDNYLDMEVIERINCKHYDSVKDMIRGEIARLETLKEELITDEDNVVYTYTEYSKTTKQWDKWHREFDHIKKSYKEIDEEITEYIEEYDDTLAYKVYKKYLNDNKTITAEYQIINKKRLMVNIEDSNCIHSLDLDNIFLNIPTPFKEGDILVYCWDTPYREGVVPDKDDIFVLDYLCTWRENLEEHLAKGNHDSSDMIGYGYFIFEDSNKIIYDDKWNYDSFEYYDGDLNGIHRTLKAISSFMKKEISIDLLLHAYEEFKTENRIPFMDCYTEESLKLAGCSEKDIQKYHGREV